MMNLNLSIDEDYIIRRLNNWYIDLYTGKIYGTTKTFYLNFETRVNGYILGFADNHVMARIDCRLYAFVLGNIEASRQDQRLIYLDYLKNKIPVINTVI